MAAPKFRFGYAEIDCLDRLEATERVVQMASGSSTGHYVVTPNADHIVLLEEDQKLREVYEGAALVVADGMPLVWFSKILKPALPERVTGSDLMPDICSAAEKHGLSIFFLGAGPGVAAKACEAIQKSYPNIKISGSYCPPMGFEKDREETLKAIDAVNLNKPDILFVGLGAPKQEYWMYDYRNLIQARVMLGIGAGIDFMAGNIQRAPMWMQKSGLEWVYRLSREPKRLFMRYAKDFAVFGVFFREFFGRSRNKD